MAMSVLIVTMMLVSLVYAVATGTAGTLTTGLLEGAGQGVSLALSMAGMLCLWSGVVEVMRQAGLMEKLARLLRAPLAALFPESRADEDLRGDIAASVSANLLGLGNAATPLSIRACMRLRQTSKLTGVASDSVCMLVILGATSIQIIPATIAAVRAAQNAANPFDILPAVWVTTVASCAAGILMGMMFRKFSQPSEVRLCSGS